MSHLLYILNMNRVSAHALDSHYYSKLYEGQKLSYVFINFMNAKNKHLKM